MCAVQYSVVYVALRHLPLGTPVPAAAAGVLRRHQRLDMTSTDYVSSQDRAIAAVSYSRYTMLARYTAMAISLSVRLSQVGVLLKRAGFGI